MYSLLYYFLCLFCATPEFSDTTLQEFVKIQSLESKRIDYCEPEFILTNVEDKIDFLYQAQKRIIVKDNYMTQTSNGAITMKAGNVIVMEPHTLIKHGSNYLARIEPCDLCGYDFDYKKYFTPNGDGVNDFWQINWFDENKFLSLHIYDRYGKLIKQFVSYDDFWDGRLNERNLISSDYWFTLEYLDCNDLKKEYKSHFSLKR